MGERGEVKSAARPPVAGFRRKEEKPLAPPKPPRPRNVHVPCDEAYTIDSGGAHEPSTPCARVLLPRLQPRQQPRGPVSGGAQLRAFPAALPVHVGPVVDTFAYCLLRNHFHLLIRVRPALDWPTGPGPSRRFADFFNGYARAINRAYGRCGSLFRKPFRRRAVTSASDLAHLVCYIHQIPQRHGLIADFRDYPHSSFPAYRDLARPSRLRRLETISWFGGIDGLESAHGCLEVPCGSGWDAE
jgi:putative transposase